MGPSQHSGIKEKLKATGASMLRSRPRMNRSHSASKPAPQQQPRQTFQQPQPQQQQPFQQVLQQQPQQDYKQAYQQQQQQAYQQQQQAYSQPPRSQNGRAYGPVHRPVPLSTVEARLTGAGQQPNHGNIPPPQQHEYAQQSMAGRGAPGHKQPRSRDRMRSTLHYDAFPPSGPVPQMASAPPQPQRPVDPHPNAPGPSQYQYAQRSYTNPSTAPGGYAGYAGQPLSATQAKNMQAQQSTQ
ncbi:hypothetical protein GGF43_000897 [Coemansia sp. RSA 2618]|nr:hypothetical protein GGF43_000897 [Coemansia sp. RSA 2618]